MKQKIVVLFYVCFFTCFIYSEQIKPDSILLHSGDWITGKIIKHVENDYIKIQTTKGEYFFAWSYIRLFHYHSSENSQRNDSIDSQNTLNSLTNKVNILKNSDSLLLQGKISTTKKQSNTELPLHIFQLKAGIGIENYKFSVLYGYRFWSNASLGVGYEYLNSYNDISCVYDNLIFDVKFLKKTVSNNLTCLAIDFGVGVYRRYGLEVGPLLMFNPSYMYGLRINRNLYLTAGIDLSFQKNIYIYNASQDIVTFGFFTGILF